MNGIIFGLILLEQNRAKQKMEYVIGVDSFSVPVFRCAALEFVVP